MSKPLIIRLCGWWSILLVGLIAVGLSMPSSPVRVLLAGLPLVVLAVTGIPAFVVWLLGTIFYAVMKQASNQQARTMAAVLRDKGLAGDAGASAAPVGRRAPTMLGLGTPPHASPAADRPEMRRVVPTLPKCEACGESRAPLHCCRHLTDLCYECMLRHDVPLECYYIPAHRAPRSERAAK